MLLLYFVHILLMKFNRLYEVAIKKSVARTLEIRELNKIAENEIDHFHKNLNSRALTIEMIKSVNCKVEGNHIIFDNYVRKKIKPITCVKFRDGGMPTTQLDNRGYYWKTLLKQSVIKIIIMIQAYKQFEKMKRNARS